MTTRPEDSVPYWIGWFGQTIATAIAKGEPISIEDARKVHDGLCAAVGLKYDLSDVAVYTAPTEAEAPKPERTVITAEMLAEHAKWRRSEGGKRLVLAGANLAYAYLAYAYLAYAYLAYANLADANLGGADLGGADLAGANLGGADLADANLGGANLAYANLADANLAYAKGNRWTTLPTGWKVENGLIVKVTA